MLSFFDISIQLFSVRHETKEISRNNSKKTTDREVPYLSEKYREFCF